MLDRVKTFGGASAAGQRGGFWVVLLVLILVVYQAIVLVNTYLLPMGLLAWERRALPVWERSALLLEGDRFAGHVGFLRQHVPEDARLILPPLERNNAYEHIGLMQYFLFPRDIHNCGHSETPAECVRRMTGETTYIIALDYFPPRAETLETKTFLQYEEDLGVFAPR